MIQIPKHKGWSDPDPFKIPCPTHHYETRGFLKGSLLKRKEWIVIVWSMRHTIVYVVCNINNHFSDSTYMTLCLAKRFTEGCHNGAKFLKKFGSMLEVKPSLLVTRKFVIFGLSSTFCRYELTYICSLEESL